MRATIAIVVPLLVAAATAQAQQASAIGIVIDSIHGGPLRGALVVVDGTGAEATVDDRGGFRIDSIPPGPHVLGVFHPLLDSLGVAVGTGQLTFVAGISTDVVLATPSVPSIIAIYCTAEERQHGAGAIIGRVTMADNDQPATNATVRYSWHSVIREHPILEGRVLPSGQYHVCGVPLGARGSIRAEQGGAVTGDMPAEVASRPLAIVPLRLPRARQANSPGAVVVGRVVDVHGVAIAGVDVLYDSVTRTVTSDSGAFTLRGLSPGSRPLEFRKVGFQVMDVGVELSTARPASIVVTLNPAPPVLATVDVTASRQKALDRVGFTKRERSTAGTFLTEREIKLRDPMTFTDLARTIAGLKVAQRNGQSVVTQPLGESVHGNGCVLYELDGTAFSDVPPGSIDSHITPNSIIAMEVYHPGAAPLQVLQDATPGDFGMPTLPNRTQQAQSRLTPTGTVDGLGAISATACTVVVIWTRATSGGA
ncbi:MAG TPA: carboxypeptidase regulatory-like domain-containing protein [Gemmatimonadaceae bacterium]|nr:carboxypeptidase regulatory-like domain-containing protein [Gemmatimonadaceae bacterium]